MKEDFYENERIELIAEQFRLHNQSEPRICWACCEIRVMYKQRSLKNILLQKKKQSFFVNSKKDEADMKMIRSGTSIVINSKFQDIARVLPENYADTVVADWPFNKGLVDVPTKRLITDGVKYANKLLKPNGTFISVNYLEPNFHVWNQASYWGLTLGDSITLLRHPMKKVKDRLAYETLSVLVFTKGEIKDRILKTACRSKGSNLIYSKEIWGTETNFWGDLKFKNGYWRKNGDRVSEAMPATCVKRLLSTFCGANAVVVDFFGGAGTVPLICRELEMPCISTELLHHRFQIISRRLSEKNQKLAQYSRILMDKAISLLDSEPYTKGVDNGKEEKWGKGKRCTGSKESKVSVAQC